MVRSTLGTSESERIGIVDGASDSVISLEAFKTRLGVDGWIRLHPADFAAMATLTERLVHFNLGTTSNVAGHRYAIVPIVRPGSRTAEGLETLPYVDVRRSRVGRCIEVRQAVPIEDVTAADFSASLPHLRSIGELRSALIERYARMYPALSDAALLNQGCAITTLALAARAGSH